ncbi:MAG TPA: ABC transporter permease [Burkholderiaceae bacterium]|nr:ABC transporter permease [Burkholderiaceae bacterium]
MTPASSLQGALADGARALGHWLQGWWRIVELGAQLTTLALSPSTYSRAHRAALLRHVVLGTVPSLLWFTALSTLLSLIVIRIVVVTSVSYGLSQYALEMVVRVLVLELIPLTAALFAALRCTIPFAAEVAALRASGRWAALQRAGADPLAAEALPRVSAGTFCALLLAAISCGVTLVLAYLAVYGFTAAGFAAYTRTVGHVFDAGVSLVFGLKILAMALAVALLPLASILIAPARERPGTSAELRGLVRMFFVLLLIEAGSLVGNYY